MKIRFVFTGGCMDGQHIVGTTAASSPDNPAARYVFLSDRGRVGARFREIPPQGDSRLREVFQLPKEVTWALVLALGNVFPGEDKSVAAVSEEELRRRMEGALRIVEQDPGLSASTLEQALAAVPQWVWFLQHPLGSEIYEVTNREQLPDELIVQVRCLGGDSQLSIA